MPVPRRGRAALPIRAPASILLLALTVGVLSSLIQAQEEARPHAPQTTEERAQEESWGLIRTIVIDPGHGGEEVGAVGRSGLYEKDLALDIARRLRERLQASHGFQVQLTREQDAVIPLRERTAIANQAGADIFLSIHLNSSRRTTARGTETYFLSLTASDEEAMSLAKEENRGGARRGGGERGGTGEESAPRESGDEAVSDLDLVLWGLAQSEHLARSSRLADLIQDEMNRLLSVESRGIKQAPFTVLMGATMPAVLVEVAFLSNKEEEALLATTEFRDRVAQALESAILRFKSESERSRRPGVAGTSP